MFSFYSVILDLIKARTHKYVRRIPVGATTTGATKYRYFYHGQEGHGKGLAHESELVVGASFVFNAEGQNKYHAHIIKIDGDKIIVEHDDGAKKGTKHIYTKEAFQKLVRDEHREALKQARQKASKQLADFQQMKERGAKVKQETLDKLQAQVNKLAEPKKQEVPKEPIEDAKLKEGIAVELKRRLSTIDTFKGFSERIAYLRIVIDDRFGKQLNESLLKDTIKPSNTIRDIASKLIDNAFIAQYDEQMKDKAFAISYPDRHTASEHVVKSTMTQGFINSLLLDIVKQLDDGIPPAQIDAHLNKKTADALREKLKSLVKDKPEKEKSTPIKNLASMPASDVLKALSTFSNKEDSRVDKLYFDTADKTILGTDGTCAVLVKNPKGITFPDTPNTGKTTYKIGKEELRTFVEDEKNDIKLSVEDEEPNKISNIMSVFSGHIKDTQAYNLTIEDNIRNMFMSIKQGAKSKDMLVKFKVDKTQNKCNVVYYEKGKEEKALSVGSFNIERTPDIREPESDETIFSLELLKKMMPYATKINFGEQDKRMALFGVDDQTQMLCMPARRY